MSTVFPRWSLGAIWTFLVLITVVTSRVSAGIPGRAYPLATRQALSTRGVEPRSPLHFEPQGSGAPNTFVASTPGVQVRVQPEGATLRFTQPLHARRSGEALPAPVKLEWVRPARAPHAQGLDPLPGRFRHYQGPDARQWRTEGVGFRRVLYSRLYPGVDLLYYGQGGQLEYDLVLHPGADPRQIRLRVSGASHLALRKDGALRIRAGSEELLQPPPVVYQLVRGERRRIAGGYVLEDGGEVGFRLASYNTRLPLVIDPVLVYSTYFGGSHSTQFEQEHGGLLAVDAQGAMYLTGDTVDDDFPLAHPVQGTQPGPVSAFVTKLDPTGQSVVYSTYLGGSKETRATGIAVDGAGNAYVCGTTNSLDFPTLNPIQSRKGAGETLFIAKLGPTGDLVYASYLGGSGGEAKASVAVDANGSPCFVGTTASADVPLKNALQTSKRGNTDMLVARLDGAGNLLFTTYLGGGLDDSAGRVAVDAAGNLVLTGASNSLDFPILHPAQAQRGGGSQEGVLARLAADGSALLSSTYLGGSGNDSISGVALDRQGNIYLSGLTQSPDFPTTPGAHARALRDGLDGFVTKLTADASTALYSSLLGRAGASEELMVNGVAVDAAGQAWVGGSARNGFYDVFLQVMSVNASTVVASEFFSGSGQDFLNSITADSGGNNIYFSGYTTSPDFPLLLPIQRTLRGNMDPFIVRIATAGPPAAPDLLTAAPLSDTSIRLRWRDNSSNEQRFEVERQSGSGNFTLVSTLPADTTAYTDTGLAANTTYTYRVRAGNAAQISAYSLPASALTLPAQLLSLAARAVSATEVDLAWSDPNPTAVAARVQRSVNQGAFWFTVATVNAGVTQYADLSADPGTQYLYRVVGTNASGDGVASATASAATPPLPPGVPAHFQITATTQNSISLDWNAAEYAASYELERSADMGNTWVLLATPGVAATDFTDAGLPAGTTFFYRLRSVNSTAKSAYTPAVTGATVPATPGVPSGIRITASPGSLLVQWTAVPGADHYDVARTDPAGARSVVTATTPSFYDVNLPVSTTYSYQVRAVNSGGASAYSAPVSGTTPPPSPSAPGNFAVGGASSNSIRLTWTAPVESVTSYHLRRSLDGGISWMDVGPPAPTATEYVDASLPPDAAIVYQLQASNGGGTGPYAGPLLAHTTVLLPETPTGLAVTRLDARSITLSWRASTGATAYVVERKSGTEGFTVVGTVSAALTQYQDQTARAGVAYTYRIKARNSAGDSDYGSSVTATIPAGGKLKPVKRTLNFGTVVRGKLVRKTLKLTNIGKGPLVVTVDAPLAPFTLVAGGGMITLAPKKSVTVTLQFAPASSGSAQTGLSITSTDPTASAVTVGLLAKGR